MFPVLRIGPWTFSAFFFFIALGIMSGALYILWQARRRGLPLRHVLAIEFLAAMLGLIGMRLFHVLVEAPNFYWQHPASIFHWSNGGFASWGAMLGVLVAFLLYVRVKRLPAWEILDTFALGFPVIYFFVRLGCLGAGCCFGAPTEFPIALVFTDPRAVAAKYYPGFMIHATQLYSMLAAIILFGIVHITAWKRRFPGQVILMFLISYGIARFSIEFWRGDSDRGVYFGVISTGQVMSLLFIAVAALLYGQRNKTYV